MRLIELHPKWIHPKMFTFVCPHCRKWLLTCKTAPMSHVEQWDLFKRLGGWRAHHIIGCNPDHSWRLEGTEWDALTVTPSIDASAAGHWHGLITAGEIR